MPIASISHRNRLILVIFGLSIVVFLLVIARGALFPLVISVILAYLLFPAIRLLEDHMPWRSKWPGATRIASIVFVYIAGLAVLAGALALIVPPAFRQATDFVDEVPELFENARVTVESWNYWYTERVPQDVREQIEGVLEDHSSVLIKAAQSLLGKTVGTVTNTVTTVIGLAIVPFMLFYLLKDREAAANEFYSLMPDETERHARNALGIANNVLGSYVRAQLTLGVIVGTAASIGLYLLGIRFAVLLGLIAGATELVPVIGPLLGAIPGVLVTLATSPESLLWVVLVYAGIQLIENSLLVPRIQGRAVQMHPIIIMMVLVVGSEAAGLFGVILSVPVAAVSRDVFRYFYEEWSGVEDVVGATQSNGPDNDDDNPHQSGTDLCEPLDKWKDR